MSPNPQSFPNSPRISAPGLLSPDFSICVFLYNTIYFPVSDSIPLLQVHFTQCTQTKLEGALENQNCTKQPCARFCSASFQRLAYGTDPLLPKARLGFITQAHSSVLRLLFVWKAVHCLLPQLAFHIIKASVKGVPVPLCLLVRPVFDETQSLGSTAGAPTDHSHLYASHWSTLSSV